MRDKSLSDGIKSKDKNILSDMKQSVVKFNQYFQSNIERFLFFKRFATETAFTDRDLAILKDIGKAQFEFNLCMSYVSRLVGEFAKYQPDIIVSSNDEEAINAEQIKNIENIFRYRLTRPDLDSIRKQIYKDQLIGGWSVWKICVDYNGEDSFEQEIYSERVFDPTLCGFDQSAKLSHKGDGEFCYEIFPLALDEFKSLYPNVEINEAKFQRKTNTFNWVYTVSVTPVILVCDFYKKVKKRVTIVETADKRTMTLKEYKKMIKNWNDFTIPPVIAQQRETIHTKIMRYRFIENEILEEVETIFKSLPLVFVDGNSEILRGSKDGGAYQFTMPYLYHIRDTQRLHNLAGSSLATEIENIVQHKWKVAEESLPAPGSAYEAAYLDVQHANLLVYKSHDEKQNPLPPPQEIPRIPAPPEIMQGFNFAAQMMQAQLGGFNSAIESQNPNLSGKAIIEGATEANSTAMPYLDNYLIALQRVAEIELELIPEVYVTQRSMPAIHANGKKSIVKINHPGELSTNFDYKKLNIKLRAGSSFQVQKTKTLMMLREAASMSPIIQQFLGEKGLSFILDNLEGRNIELLKQQVEQYQKELEMQKQQAQQMAMQQAQQNPAAMAAQAKMMELQQKDQHAQAQHMIDMLKVQNEQQVNETKRYVETVKAHNQTIKSETERYAKDKELQIKLADVNNRHALKAHEIAIKHRSQYGK